MQTNDKQTYTDAAEAQAWLRCYADDLATRLQAGVRVPSGSLLDANNQTTFEIVFSLMPSASVETQKEDGTVAKPLLFYVGNNGADRKHSSMAGGKQPVFIHWATPQSVLPATVLRALCDVAWSKVSEPALTKEGTPKLKADGTPELRWKDPAGKTEFLKVSTLKGKAKEGFQFERGSIAEELVNASLKTAGPLPNVDLKLWQLQAPKGEDPYKTVQCKGDAARSTKVRHFTIKTTQPELFVNTEEHSADFAVKHSGKWLTGACPKCFEALIIAPTKAEKEAAQAAAEPLPKAA